MTDSISDQVTEKLPPPVSVSAADLRAFFEQKLLDAVDIAAVITMPDAGEMPQNSCHIAFNNINGEMLSARLLARGISVLTASPCNNVEHKLSPEIKALGLPFSQAMGIITFRLDPDLTGEVIEKLVVVINEEVDLLKQIGGVD